MTHILAMTSPARGLLYPIVETVLTLRARGHDVHIVTITDEVPLLRELGLGASPLPTGLDDATPGDQHVGARSVRSLTDRLVERADAVEAFRRAGYRGVAFVCILRYRYQSALAD